MPNKYIQNFLPTLKTDFLNLIKEISFWRDLIAGILMLLFLNPKFSFINQFICIFLCTLWILLAFITSKEKLIQIIKSRLFTFFCIFPLISIMFWLSNYALINKHILLIPFILLLSLYYLCKENKNVIYFIVFFMLGYLFLITFTTLIKLQTMPDLTRLLARGDKDVIANIITPFTATYATTYSISFVGIVLFGVGINNQNRTLKIICYIATVYILYFLFKAAYTISLIIYILGLVLITAFFIWNRIKDKKKALKIILISVIILLITYFFTRNIIADFILSLQKFAPDLMQQRRIQEIARLVRNFGIESEGGMINRFNLYLLSILTFIKNPFFGVGFKEQYLYTNEGVLNPLIGNHSTIFDMLASYGILGLFYIISIPMYYYKILKGIIPDEFSILKIILILFVVLSLINTTENIAFYYIMIFLIPAIVYILPKNKMEDN